MTPLYYENARSDARGARRKRTSSTRLALALVLVQTLLFVGCESLKNHKRPIFSPDGKGDSCLFSGKSCLFSNSDNKKSCLFSEDSCLFSGSKAKRLSDAEAADAIARANANQPEKDVWGTPEEQAQLREKLKEYDVVAQRPNGGVLFPERLTSTASQVALAPSAVVAPVGSDVVLVASYVGDGAQYLRVGEKIDWVSSGVGSFTEANTSASFLPWASTRQTSGRSLTTTTTDQLWRVHRGTDSPIDDVTVLRGQTWAAYSSQEEGESDVAATASSVGDSRLRSAVSRIYWVDLAHKFPRSQVARIGDAISLNTTTLRRSNGQPYKKLLVCYDVLSGDALLSDASGRKSRSWSGYTDENGVASASLTASGVGDGGTSKVLASLYLPNAGSERGVLVDKRTLFYTWTTNATMTARFLAPDSYDPGVPFDCKLIVTNLSDFAQDCSVQLTLPEEVVDVKTTEDWPVTENKDRHTPKWELKNVQPGASCEIYPIQLTVKEGFEGSLNVNAIISWSGLTEPGAANSAGALGAIPPTTMEGGAAAQPLGATPPTESPDPASSQPAL